MTGEAFGDAIDRRSGLFAGLTQENLAGVANAWPTTRSTPKPVAAVLLEARRLFVGAFASYDNLTAACLRGLQAAELALGHRLGPRPNDRRTLGQLIKAELVSPVLDASTREWYTEFALHFRNRLAHPDGAQAFSPGIAEGMLRTTHERVAGMFRDDRES